MRSRVVDTVLTLLMDPVKIILNIDGSTDRRTDTGRRCTMKGREGVGEGEGEGDSQKVRQTRV